MMRDEMSIVFPLHILSFCCSSNSSTHSKKGHLFCKECILEFIVERKKDIERQTAAWKLDQQKRENERLAKDEAEKQKKVAEFDRSVLGFSAGTQKRSTDPDLAANNRFHDPNYKLTAFWVVRKRKRERE
jgi:hypothetical protein